MRVLVAGTGSIGRRHLGNLRTLGVKDLALYSTGHSTLPLDDLAGLPRYRSLEEALEWGPDALVVANPTACHLEVAIPAAHRGCHILMEKPVSHDRQGLHDLRMALKLGGGSLLMGFQFRFHPTLGALAEGIRQGALGTILSARVEWGEYLPDWHPWEDYRQGYVARAELGGGVARTLTHPFDYLRWILGEATTLSWAHVRRTRVLDLDVEDEVEAGFLFQSGAMASVHLDLYRRPPVHRLEVVGTEGVASWRAEGGELSWLPSDGDSPRLEMPPGGFGRNTLFLDEMIHFLAIVRGEAKPLCTLEDGVRALEMALAILNASSRLDEQ